MRSNTPNQALHGSEKRPERRCSTSSGDRPRRSCTSTATGVTPRLIRIPISSWHARKRRCDHDQQRSRQGIPLGRPALGLHQWLSHCRARTGACLELRERFRQATYASGVIGTEVTVFEPLAMVRSGILHPVRGEGAAGWASLPGGSTCAPEGGEPSRIGLCPLRCA